jgi:hypothetical protein
MADGLRYLAGDRIRAAIAAAAAAAATAAACGRAAPASELSAAAPVSPASASATAAGAGAPGGAAWRSCLQGGATPCVSAAPVRVGSELLAWSDWIAAYADRHAAEHALPITECRWVAELDQVLLCGSPDPEAMNSPLLRASIFVENLPRVVVERGHPLYRELMLRVGGHDLLKQHPRGARLDLLGFYEALDAACAGDRGLCADPGERAMRALLERAWADKPRFVLLAFARRGGVPDDEAVSHEILHAQFFSDARYRAVIDGYWRGLPEAQRAAARAELGELYNPDDEELIANELQAYVLMSGAERSRFATLVEPHGPALARLLAARGLAPIAVQRRAPEPAPAAPAPGEP